MKQLRLAPGLSLPLDVVTRATCITGQRGTGKTSSAAVLVEEAAAAGAPSVVIDPTDAWWGLRSSADGKGPGLPHIVFGGEHGHLPLREESGAVMARLVVEQRLSAVFSLKHMRKGAQLRFVTELLEELYHLNREALLVVIDEAHRFAPQQALEKGGYVQRCLGAAIDIATLGRVNGLGIALVTQRLARLHKDVTEACEIMVIHRLLGPNDRKAIEAWLRDAGQEDEAAELGRKLPKLKRGEALVYAPDLDVLGQFTIRPKRTFDSSGTPEVGSAKVEPKGVAEVDLSAIEAQIGETIAQAKADDPKELRKLLAERDRQAVAEPKEVEVERIVEVVPEALAEQIGSAHTLSVAASESLEGVMDVLIDVRRRLDELPPQTARPVTSAPSGRSVAASSTARPPAPKPTGRGSASAPAAQNGHDPQLKAGARRMLAAMASLHPAWLTRAQVGTLAKIKHTGGTFGDYLSALRTAGAIEEQGSGPRGELRISEHGFGLLGEDVPAPATTEELLSMWRDRLKRGARLMLDALVEAHPNWLAREDLAATAGIEVTGGTFGDYLSMLRRTGLIEEDARLVRASETLFLGAVS